MTLPHENTPVYTGGMPMDEAWGLVILIHGRGASAESMLTLAAEFKQENIAYLAPQAAGFTWYPQRFIAPKSANEPYLSSALEKIDAIIQYAEDMGIPSKRVVLLGFSQGACLAAEYAATRPRRYGGVIVLSGGLIGELGQPLHYPSDENPAALDGTPIFLGSADVDAHIPLERVHESAQVFQQLGAEVMTRIYAGLGHTVNDDELAFARELIANLR